MRTIGVIRYYRHFRKGVAPAAIPVSGVRCPCIPHPFAAIQSSSYPLERIARLACLSHAASVRSEPGSNSSLFYSLRHPTCRDGSKPAPHTERFEQNVGSHFLRRKSERRRRPGWTPTNSAPAAGTDWNQRRRVVRHPANIDVPRGPSHPLDDKPVHLSKSFPRQPDGL